MDGDDIAYPERLRKQVEYLDSHLDVDLIGTGIVVFRGRGEAYGSRRAAISHEAICGNVLSGLRLAHPTWTGRPEWFRHNPYRAGFWLTEDRELLMRTRNTSSSRRFPSRFSDIAKMACACERLFPHATSPRAYLEDAFTRGHLLYGLGGSSLPSPQIGSGHSRNRYRRATPNYGHRARPLPDKLRDEWLDVWRQTMDPTGQRGIMEGDEIHLRIPVTLFDVPGWYSSSLPLSASPFILGYMDICGNKDSTLV